MRNLLLALDFGGTKLTAALAARSALPEADSANHQEEKRAEPGAPAWLAQQRVFSPQEGSAQFDLDTMVSLSQALLAGQQPAAVGVSFGGPVDYESGTVRLSHHVPGWENIRLQQILEREFGAPARVDNDANVAALGEYRFGAGRGYDDLLYVTVSTGVGGGWILNGRPWRGYQGVAGEIGHTVVDPNGPLCLCGKRGCVERLASGPYMAQDFMAERGSGGAGERGSGGAGERGNGGAGEQGSRGAGVTGKRVAALAAEGDSVAQRLLERGAWALGVAIGNAANLINPRLFVLGGGVTKSGELWWSAVRRAARRTALPEVDFEVVPAALGDDAPLWGAVALAESVIAVVDPGRRASHPRSGRGKER